MTIVQGDITLKTELFEYFMSRNTLKLKFDVYDLSDTVSGLTDIITERK